MIGRILSHIKKQTNLEVRLCDYFTGLHEHNGEIYFNIVTEKPTRESVKLLKLADLGSLVTKIEENGFKRIAVYINQ